MTIKYCRVLAVVPNDVDALTARGYCLRKLRQYDEAADVYAAALKLTSEPSLKLLNNHAYCLAAAGRYDESINVYTEALLINPDNAHALHNRYVPFYTAHPVTNTLLTVSKLTCGYCRAIAYDKVGNFGSAVRDYSSVISLEPRNVNAYYSEHPTLAISCYKFTYVVAKLYATLLRVLQVEVLHWITLGKARQRHLTTGRRLRSKRVQRGIHEQRSHWYLR